MISFTSLIIATLFAPISHTAKLTVLVIDDVTKEPIPDVDIRYQFFMDNGWKAWTESAMPNVEIRTTDENGVCKVKGSTNTGHVSINTMKIPEGYYPTWGGFVSRSADTFGNWLPDDSVITMKLQRVEHPIPMFVKQVWRMAGKTPHIGSWDGKYGEAKYDLMKGDFLPPEGKGEYADLTFKLRVVNTWGGMLSVSAREVEMYEMELEIEFPNDGDGLRLVSKEDKGTGIKIRSAETKGYARTTTRQFGNRIKSYDNRGWIIHEPYDDIDKMRCYTFRIRTKYNEKGEIIDGYYGKIYGDFDFEASGKRGLSSMRFLYYLNPTPLDTNLEWDMKTNLYTGKGFLNNIMP